MTVKSDHDRGIRFLVAAAALVIIIRGTNQAQSVLVSFLVAVFFAIIGTPVRKSAAAMLLENRIGEQFDAIVTGAAEKGTWARLLAIPVEGRVEHGFEGLDVGNRIRVQLISVDVDRGYIDFRKVGPSRH